MVQIITILFVIVSFLMIGAILLQSSKTDGLGAGFGALGGTNVFGGRGANDFLKKFTTYLAVIFVLSTIFIGKLDSDSSAISSENALLKDAKANTTEQAPVSPTLDLPAVPEESNDSVK